uniref:Sec1 family protein n=1 Tax=Gongylonema pulchrum TaxID=637853 RepID=A0A183E3H9_9BILA
LDQKLRDNFRDARHNLFAQDNMRAGRLILHRPVLIIADRGQDKSGSVDFQDLDLNRVVIKDKTGRRKEYDMNPHDKLWMNHKGSSFPLVAEAIQQEVEAYKNSEDEIKRLKHAMGMDDVESDETLDVLFEAEEKIMNGQLSDTSVLELMRQCSDHQDALRVMLINYLCSTNISADELKMQMDYLKEVGLDDAAVKFVRQLRSISNMNLSRMASDYSGGGIKTDSMFANLLNRGSQLFMEGVKNLVPRKHNLPLTKMVDAIIMGTSQGAARYSEDEFRYYDPKLIHSTGKEPQRGRGNPAQDVIVFVIGGGNYVEYQNVMDYGKSRGLSRITYGCTELVGPKQFVEQLTRLGRQML